MKKTILYFALAILGFSTAKGQGNEFIMSWQVATPSKPLADLIPQTTFNGWAFEYRYSFTKTLTAGASVGYNIFHQEIDRSTWHLENVAITSHNWRFTHCVPLTVNFHFNPLRNAQTPWQVFLGGGLGTAYVNNEVWAGMYTIRQESWGFHYFPEVGLRCVMSDQTAIIFSTQYMTVVNGYFGEENMSYLNMKLGLSFGRHKFED